jgi:flavodoxin
MKILIAYYSWQGHTETVALELAQKLNTQTVKIEPLQESGSGIFMKAMKALFSMREKIKPCTTDMKEIDHLVIATPVWAHKIPPYVRQYISELTNCSGKRFSVVAEMGGSGAEGAIAAVRKVLEAKGMKFVNQAQTLEKDVEAKQFGATLDRFAEKIKEI